MEAVCAALGVEIDRAQRVIIDASFDDFVRVYFQMVGDERLLKLDLTTLLEGAKIEYGNR